MQNAVKRNWSDHTLKATHAHALRLSARLAQLSIAGFIAAWIAPAASMTIEVEHKRTGAIARILGASVRIYLAGDIESDSPARVREVLQSVKDADVHVAMDSRGGNLVAGIAIGRLLREHGVTVTIGRKGGTAHLLPGVCFSACALAYLGGEFRYIESGSAYGVHRASRPGEPRRGDLATGQLVAATVAAYYRDMDVDPRLLDLTMRVSNDEIYVLSETEVIQLGVANNGRKRPRWTIEVIEGGTYLRGEQETVFGLGKLVLLCHTSGEFHLLSVYSAGAERAHQIATGSWVHSLFLDRRLVPLDPPTSIEAKGEYLNAMFIAPAEFLIGMQTAVSVGHAMQVTREAPTFVGYSVDIDASSRQRVRTYARNCLALR